MKRKISLFLLVLVSVFTLICANVKVKAETDGYENAQALFAKYYNNGFYLKESTIYVNDVASAEVKAYFHAGCNHLERTTYYLGSELWMTNDAGVNSGYGTSDAGMTHFEKVNGQNVVDYTVPGTTMEDYYTTLFDISTSDDQWTLSNGVYTSTDPDAIQDFIDFTAPLWVGTNKENSQYLQYHHVEASEESGVLTLSLYVSATDQAKVSTEVINNEYALFSEAKVQYLTNKTYIVKHSETTSTSNSTPFENYAEYINLDSHWNVTCTKNSNGLYCALNKDGDIRLYGDSSKPSVLEFSLDYGLISNVSLVCSGSYNQYVIKDIDENTFTINSTNTSQVRILSMEIQAYVGSYEEPVPTYSVEISEYENGNVTINDTSIDLSSVPTGTELKFVIEPDEGYYCSALKINGESVLINEDNTYSHVVVEDIVVSAEFAVETQNPDEPSVVATFTFGANGTASHSDGSSTSSYSETNGGYTLTLSSISNVYKNARDAKGNSCLKLGASSKAGSFSFTVDEDVTEVVIYVAKYKANTTKITVNGTSYTISTASINGAYTAITIDTTTTKSISLTTVSGGYRCMVDKIEYIK